VFFQEYYRHIPVRSFGFKASGNVEVHVTPTFLRILIDKTKTCRVNIFASNRKCTKIYTNHIQTMWEIKNVILLHDCAWDNLN